MQIIDRELAKLVSGFHSTTRANTRLLKLTRAGLLNRFFIGSIAAGRKAIYTLSPRGGLLAAADYRRISRSHGKTLVGDLYVDHQMRINEAYVTVKHKPLPSGLRFRRWRSFHEPFTENARLVPDGYVELQSTAAVLSIFLEIDMGNQSMRVWEQKTRQYLQFAISGDFSRIFGGKQFRVLIITISRRRLLRIRSVIAKQTDKLFWLSDFHTINRAGFWSAIWHRPTGDQQLALIG
ncbi:MAG: replication-relaxation family protein [Acidobacteriaceae bacterium]|nr:replication-relaxation family protein [Acidobacteriaceae bacterium]